MAKTDSKKMVKVTLKRSMIGRTEKQRANVRGLGLRRLNHTVEVEDTPCTRGMMAVAGPFIEITEV